MRLKEIKQGMVIHCKSNDERKALYDELCRIGNMETDRYSDSFDNFKCADYNYKIQDLKRGTWSFTTEPATVWFSDLIIPDLTAEELLQIINDICNTYSNCAMNCKKECPFCNGYCKEWMAKHHKETVEICAQWKYDHEKKEPEIETVDICRIIEILPDGRKRCVHEEDIEADPELPYGGEQLAVEQILKRYCMEHDGEYIAVHEVVSRVKAV